MQAGYGYGTRGYSRYSDVAPKTDDWSKTSYASSDHLDKPVFVDGDGRKHPIVSYSPIGNQETRIIETETIVTQVVHSPSADGHRHAAHMKVEPLSHVEDGRQRWSSLDHGRLHKVEELLTKTQTETTPKKIGLLSHSAWRQTPKSTGHHGQGHTHGPDSGYGDYSYRNSKDQHKPSGHTIHHGDHDGYNHSNHIRQEPHLVTSGGWSRPSHSGWAAPPHHSLSAPTNNIGTAVEYLQDAARHTTPVTTPPYSRVSVPITTGPTPEYYSQTNHSPPYSRVSTPLTTGPKRDDYGRYSPPNTHVNSPVTTGTRRDDYGHNSPPYSRVSAPITMRPKRDEYDQTIDSREAARRYGNLISPSLPEERYTGTIDSREAARKYNGTAL